MDIEEEEVLEAEAMAGSLRRQIAASGDQNIVRLMKQLPEESWARLKRLMTDKT
jgi:hypothetical protein